MAGGQVDMLQWFIYISNISNFIEYPTMEIDDDLRTKCET